MTWSWHPKWIVSRMRHDVEKACVSHRTDHALVEAPYDLTAWRWSSVFSMFYQCVITCVELLGAALLAEHPQMSRVELTNILGTSPSWHS